MALKAGSSAAVERVDSHKARVLPHALVDRVVVVHLRVPAARRVARGTWCVVCGARCGGRCVPACHVGRVASRGAVAAHSSRRTPHANQSRPSRQSSPRPSTRQLAHSRRMRRGIQPATQSCAIAASTRGAPVRPTHHASKASASLRPRRARHVGSPSEPTTTAAGLAGLVGAAGLAGAAATAGPAESAGAAGTTRAGVHCQ
eukprot:scaffold70466_cov76-Phaeocystis_antarctica.AAC.4